MELELTGIEVLQSYLAIAILVVLMIYFFRRTLARHYKHILDQEKSDPTTSKQYRNVLKETRQIFGIGISISLTLVLCGFSWTKYDRSTDIGLYPLAIEDILDIEPPSLPPPPSTPPPPKALVIEEIPAEEPIEEKAELLDTYVDDNTVMEPTTIEAKNNTKETIAPPPLPPPPIEENEPEIFVAVEQMPLFGNCSDRVCSDKALIQYIYKHLKYPTIAQENGIEGRVTLKFVVNTDGKISDIAVLRDIGGGCGEAARRVINDINTLAKGFEPGRQQGKAVRVMFTLPVNFKLKK